jgi:hypothetical protein
MKQLLDRQRLDDAAFLGMLLGGGLLVTCYFFEETRYLAVPALAVLFPSLVWGMR